MCTVSYVPTADGFVLTSSRDEQTTRASALAPRQYSHNDAILFYPLDPKGMGTWICTNLQSKVLCLLNGAFEPHEFTGPYRFSRGKVVLDAMHYRSPLEFIGTYSLKQIEPFTLIWAEKKQLVELVWDGSNVHLKELESEMPFIWSSVTLYNPMVRQKRADWFAEYLTTKATWDPMRFHLFAGDGVKEHNVRMQRDTMLQTVSISSIRMEGVTSSFTYFDCATNQESVLTNVTAYSTV